MARSLNKVQLIGNLTRDPELRYTPQGTAVCTFGVATNRQWKTDSGEMKDEAEFHKIVAWNQLAEICSKMLHKGSRVYVEGRLQTRSWTGQDGSAKQTVEIVVNDMLVLESKKDGAGSDSVPDDFGDAPAPEGEVAASEESKEEVKEEKKPKKGKETNDQKDESEDIPF